MTKAKRKTGPKPKPPEVLQRERVMVSLTRAERAKLEAAADGENLGTYVRAVLLRHLSRR